MPSFAAKTLFSGAGFVASVAANLLLAFLWVHWSRSAWADCPNYAFSLPWFPEPPLPVTAFPGLLTFVGIACFAAPLLGKKNRGELSPAQRWVSIAGLILSCLPLIAAVLLPTISNLLRLTKSGC